MNLFKCTLGSTVNEVPSVSVVMTEATYAANQSLPWHGHSRATLCALLEGSYTEEFRNSAHGVRRSDLIFKPEGAEHRDTYGNTGARCLILELMPEWLADLRENADIISTPSVFPSGRALDLVHRVQNEFTNGDSLSGLAIEALTLELLVHMSRFQRTLNATHIPRWLRRVNEMLHAKCLEPVTLAELAKEGGIHPGHLVQSFRKAYGMSIGQYLRTLRVTAAAQQLATTDQPLSEISLSCGFYDQSHFNRVFRKHMNATPGEYRRQHMKH